MATSRRWHPVLLSSWIARRKVKQYDYCSLTIFIALVLGSANCSNHQSTDPITPPGPHPIVVLNTHPEWSPDGREIVYVHHNLAPSQSYGESEIRIYNCATGSWRSVATGQHPRWAPDGNSLIYEFNDVIWRHYLQTGQSHVIFDKGRCLEASENPVSGTLAVATDYLDPERYNIWTVSDSAGSPTNVTQGRTGREPRWSNSGQYILFTRDANESHLVRIDPTTGQETALTGDGAIDRYPEWSDDDNYVFLFHEVLNDTATSGIWRARADGTQAQFLVRNGYRVSSSPLDSALVFDAYDSTGTYEDLWVSDWNGQNVRRLLSPTQGAPTEGPSLRIPRALARKH